jgi:hypothetical protein
MYHATKRNVFVCRAKDKKEKEKFLTDEKKLKDNNIAPQKFPASAGNFFFTAH